MKLSFYATLIVKLDGFCQLRHDLQLSEGLRPLVVKEKVDGRLVAFRKD